MVDSAASDTATAAAWLATHKEDHAGGPAADLNQYWYSASTVGTYVYTNLLSNSS